MIDDLIIKRHRPGEEIPMGLLLEADPEPEFIKHYVKEGELFIVSRYDNLVGVFVLMGIDFGRVEIKNMAVSMKYRGKGIGRKMLNHIIQYSKDKGHIKIRVCTGNSSIRALQLYQKEGFDIIEVDKGFFARNYAEPIWEGGLICEDRVILEKDL